MNYRPPAEILAAEPIGFLLSGEMEMWLPRSVHAWPDFPKVPGIDRHTYDYRCAVCAFAERPEARDAVLERLAANAVCPTCAAAEPDYSTIVWRPGRMGGEATIGQSRLTANTLAGFVWAGDSVEFTAESYEVPTFAVELSCWWVALHHPAPNQWQRQARKAWRKWALVWGDWAWLRSAPDDKYPHPGPPCSDPSR